MKSNTGKKGRENDGRFSLESIVSCNQELER